MTKGYKNEDGNWTQCAEIEVGLHHVRGYEVEVDAHQINRVMLLRRYGWRMPPNTVSVARPHKWGNPYVIGQVMQDRRYRYINGCGESFELRDGIWIPDAETAVRAFRHWLRLNPAKIKELRDELAGKNLACWCKPGTPCHADVLLDLANISGQPRLARGDKP